MQNTKQFLLSNEVRKPEFVVAVTQKYKPWMMRPQVFMGIHVCSLAKQIQRSFDKSLHCHEILVQMQIPKVLSAGMPLLLMLFLSSKKAFYVLSYDFQMCVCDMPMVFNCWHLLCVQERWSCELIATKSGNRLMFFGCIVTKSFNKVNISEKNLQC